MFWLMLWVLILAVCTVMPILLGCYLILKKNQELVRSLVVAQQDETRRLTNLVASKDIAAFTTLQNSPNPTTVSQPFSSFDPTFVPKDDVNLAKILATRYSEQGLDPNTAYTKEDFSNEFGGVIIT